MHRIIQLGVAAAALMAAPAALQADDTAQAERAYASSARSFSTCLLEATTAVPARTDLANVCLLQETALRRDGVRLRMTRGEAEQQALNDAEADIIAGRRMVASDQAQRYALAR